MPKRGDKLYNYSSDGFQTVIFLKEHIVSGATVPTWLVKSESYPRINISKDYYKTTKREAIEQYIKDCRSILDYQIKKLCEETTAVHILNQNITKAENALDSESE